MPIKPNNLIGQRFGKLIVIKEWALCNGWDDNLDVDIHRINNASIYSPETCEFLNSSEHIKLHWCIYRENNKR